MSAKTRDGGPIYTKDGRSVWTSLGKGEIVRPKIRLRTDAGK